MGGSDGVIATLRQRLKQVGETTGWIAGIAASLVALVHAYPDLSQTAHSIYESVSHGRPSSTAVFASNDRPFADSYLKLLAERGIKTRYVTLSELDSLSSDLPGLLLVHDARPYQRFAHIPLNESTLESLRRKAKVIAFGAFGADLLSDIDPISMVGKIAHGNDLAAVLDDPQLPHDIGGNLRQDQKVPLYNPVAGSSRSDIAVAYDDGSTALQGAIGVARAGELPRDPCQGAHWSIVLDGNLALWGYPRHAATLTKEGEELFGHLAVYMLKTEYRPVSGASTETPPSKLEDRLGCGSQSRTYRFRPTTPGKVRAEVQASAPVALMLNAPSGKLLQRFDKASSLIEQDVTTEDLKPKNQWAVRLVYFGKVDSATSIPYTLSLDYPVSPAGHSFGLIVAGIATAIIVFAVGRLWFIARARRA